MWGDARAMWQLLMSGPIGSLGCIPALLYLHACMYLSLSQCAWGSQDQGPCPSSVGACSAKCQDPMSKEQQKLQDTRQAWEEGGREKGYYAARLLPHFRNHQKLSPNEFHRNGDWFLSLHLHEMSVVAPSLRSIVQIRGGQFVENASHVQRLCPQCSKPRFKPDLSHFLHVIPHLSTDPSCHLYIFTLSR